MNAFNGFVVGLVGLLMIVAGVFGLLMIVAGVFILLVGTETISVADVPGEAFDQQLAVMASKTGASWWADMGIAIGLIVSGVVLLTAGVHEFDPRRHTGNGIAQFGRGGGSAGFLEKHS